MHLPPSVPLLPPRLYYICKGEICTGEEKNVNVSDVAAGVAAEVPHAHLSPQHIEGNVVVEVVFGPLPPAQNEGRDVVAVVGDVASGYLSPPQMDDGVMAEVASGHLPPHTQADVAIVVAEAASGDLSLLQTEDDCSLLLNVDWEEAEAEAVEKVGVEAKAKVKAKARASIMAPRFTSENFVPTPVVGSLPSSYMYNNMQASQAQPSNVRDEFQTVRVSRFGLGIQVTVNIFKDQVFK